MGADLDGRIDYLLVDLDGTCYGIDNKYEDHVRSAIIT